jgi:hypothetical protein
MNATKIITAARYRKGYERLEPGVKGHGLLDTQVRFTFFHQHELQRSHEKVRLI